MFAQKKLNRGGTRPLKGTDRSWSRTSCEQRQKPGGVYVRKEILGLVGTERSRWQWGLGEVGEHCRNKNSPDTLSNELPALMGPKPK